MEENDTTLYVVSRTSEWKDTVQPCEEAVLRTVGSNKYWVVEVVDTRAFVDKYGDCVIRKRRDGLYELEIYDDYRE